MTEPTKIKLNAFHKAVRDLVEKYLSSINLSDWEMDEETIRNLPILDPLKDEEGFTFRADTFGKVFVQVGSTRFASRGIRPSIKDKKWEVVGGPGRNIRINLFRKTLTEFWGVLENKCFKRLPKDKQEVTTKATKFITGGHDFARYVENAFQRDHKLDITIIPGVVYINGQRYVTILTWKKLR